MGFPDLMRAFALPSSSPFAPDPTIWPAPTQPQPPPPSQGANSPDPQYLALAGPLAALSSSFLNVGGGAAPTPGYSSSRPPPANPSAILPLLQMADSGGTAANDAPPLPWLTITRNDTLPLLRMGPASSSTRDDSPPPPWIASQAPLENGSNPDGLYASPFLRFLQLDPFGGGINPIASIRNDPTKLGDSVGQDPLQAFTDPLTGLTPSQELQAAHASAAAILRFLNTPLTAPTERPVVPDVDAMLSELSILGNITTYEAPLTIGEALGDAAMLAGPIGGMFGRGAAIAEAAGPRLIGSLAVPKSLRFGTTDFGNYAHKAVADLLRELHPDVPFIFRVLPGQRGVDVTVPGKFVDQVGYPFAEIKPMTASGEATFRRQVQRWGLDKVQAITYDELGNVYKGFR